MKTFFIAIVALFGIPQAFSDFEGACSNLVKSKESVKWEEIAHIPDSELQTQLNEARLRAAETVLGKTLNPEEKNAIIEAHLIPKDLGADETFVDGITKQSVLNKTRILAQDNLFTSDEIRLLMEKEIVGNETHAFWSSASDVTIESVRAFKQKLIDRYRVNIVLEYKDWSAFKFSNKVHFKISVDGEPATAKEIAFMLESFIKGNKVSIPASKSSSLGKASKNRAVAEWFKNRR